MSNSDPRAEADTHWVFSTAHLFAFFFFSFSRKSQTKAQEVAKETIKFLLFNGTTRKNLCLL